MNTFSILNMTRKIPYLFLVLAVHLAINILPAQSLIRATEIQHYNAAEINGLIQLTGDTTQVLFGVTTYAIQYNTPDIHGVLDTASGFVAIPDGDNSFPVLFYQHGTASNRNEVPSRGSGESILATIAAGFGYITIAPDYLGLGDSKGFHPYLYAKAEASCAYDLFVSLLPYLDQQNIKTDGQLFVTGYSQGGHAAMALHNFLEGNDLPECYRVAAAAPMSGPYSVSGEMVRRLSSDQGYNYPGYAIYTLLSYNSVYSLFDSLPQVIKAPYIPAVQEFMQEKITLSVLHQQLLTTLTQETGSTLVRDLFVDSVITKLENPADPVLLALQANDTYNWAPEAPTRLVYCMNDDQVVYTNALLADSVMNVLGANDLTSVDVFPQGDHGACVLPAVKYTLDFFAQVQAITSRKEVSGYLSTLFPNPAKDQVQLTGLPSGGFVRLNNELGQEILRQPVSGRDMRLQIPALPNGVYLITVSGPRGQSTKKLFLLQNQ